MIFLLRNISLLNKSINTSQSKNPLHNLMVNLNKDVGFTVNIKNLTLNDQFCHDLEKTC